MARSFSRFCLDRPILRRPPHFETLIRDGDLGGRGGFGRWWSRTSAMQAFFPTHNPMHLPHFAGAQKAPLLLVTQRWRTKANLKTCFRPRREAGCLQRLL